MTSILIKLVVIIAIIVLIAKMISRRKANNQIEESKYESVDRDEVVCTERVHKERPKRVHEEEVRNEKTVRNRGFIVKPQFKMCGNCLYWQGERERIKYSNDVKIIDDREMAKCSNEDAYHKAPIDKRRASAAGCKCYKRW